MADFDPGTGLGPRLRLVRGSRQLSVRELARRVGCSASLISQIERGVSVPSVGVLYSLATELGSSLDYLLFGSGAGPEGVSAETPRPAAMPEARGPRAGRAAARDRAAGLRPPDHRPGQRRALGTAHPAVRGDDRLPRGDLLPRRPFHRRAAAAAARRARVRPDHQRHADRPTSASRATSWARATRSRSIPRRRTSTSTRPATSCARSGWWFIPSRAARELTQGSAAQAVT